MLSQPADKHAWPPSRVRGGRHWNPGHTRNTWHFTQRPRNMAWAKESRLGRRRVWKTRVNVCMLWLRSGKSPEGFVPSAAVCTSGGGGSDWILRRLTSSVD